MAFGMEPGGGGVSGFGGWRRLGDRTHGGGVEQFCRLLGQLAGTMSQIASELMDEEKIAIEAESDLLWVQVEGYPEAYSVQLILNAGRRCEGFWPAAAVPTLVQAAKVLKVF